MSDNYQLPKSARLLSTEQFRVVFQTGRKHAFGQFGAFVCANQEPKARLGLSIAKRHVKLATRRNRLKRHLRESFRQASPGLPAVDVVFVAYGGANELTAEAVREQCKKLWQRLNTSPNKPVSGS